MATAMCKINSQLQVTGGNTSELPLQAFYLVSLKSKDKLPSDLIMRAAQMWFRSQCLRLLFIQLINDKNQEGPVI